jgi:DNA replication initiation complex subunit (GINS family)
VTIEGEISLLKTRKEKLDSELGSDFESSLTSEEESLLTTLSTEIEELKVSLIESSSECSKVKQVPVSTLLSKQACSMKPIRMYLKTASQPICNPEKIKQFKN